MDQTPGNKWEKEGLMWQRNKASQIWKKKGVIKFID